MLVRVTSVLYLPVPLPSIPSPPLSLPSPLLSSPPPPSPPRYATGQEKVLDRLTLVLASLALQVKHFTHVLL